MMLHPGFQTANLFSHVHLVQFIASKHLRAKQWRGAHKRDNIYENNAFKIMTYPLPDHI